MDSTHDSASEGLMAFYDSAGGPNWIDSDGWGDTANAAWYGLGCNANGELASMYYSPHTNSTTNNSQTPTPQSTSSALPAITQYTHKRAATVKCVRILHQAIHTSDVPCVHYACSTWCCAGATPRTISSRNYSPVPNRTPLEGSHIGNHCHQTLHPSRLDQQCEHVTASASIHIHITR